MLNDVAMLGANTARTRAYITGLCAARLLPRNLVLLDFPNAPGFSDLEKMAVSSGMNVTVVSADNVNAANVVNAVANFTERYVVFSGPPGAIVRKPLFATGKSFIHVHPGRLPAFRGSTTIYYSLLAGEGVAATAILLAEDIDTGPAIGRASFQPPADRTTIDRDYDADIRTQLLVSVLNGYERTGRFTESAQGDRAETFYVIHPVLKHLAILAH